MSDDTNKTGEILTHLVHLQLGDSECKRFTLNTRMLAHVHLHAHSQLKTAALASEIVALASKNQELQRKLGAQAVEKHEDEQQLAGQRRSELETQKSLVPLPISQAPDPPNTLGSGESLSLLSSLSLSLSLSLSARQEQVVNVHVRVYSLTRTHTGPIFDRPTPAQILAARGLVPNNDSHRYNCVWSCSRTRSL